MKQDSYFYWREDGGNLWHPSAEHFDYERSMGAFSAFTVAELGEMLPYNIDFGESITYFFGVRKGYDGKWATFYGNGLGVWRLTFSWYDTDTEADARAKMLIYLFENNLLIV